MDHQKLVIMAHNHIFQKAFTSKLVSLTMPMTEIIPSNLSYNIISKPTEAEGI